MDVPVWVICVLMGAAGGFIKSALEHKGKIIYPRFDRHCFVLGFGLDLICGSFVGLLSYDPTVYSLFGSSAPSWALSGMLGFSSLIFLEAIPGRLFPHRLNPEKPPKGSRSRDQTDHPSQPLDFAALLPNVYH